MRWKTLRILPVLLMITLLGMAREARCQNDAKILHYVCLPEINPPVPSPQNAAQIAAFLESNGKFLDNASEELSQNPEFARAIMGQNTLFAWIQTFEKTSGFQVKVRFLDPTDGFTQLQARLKEAANAPCICMLAEGWLERLQPPNLFTKPEPYYYNVRLLWYRKSEIADPAKLQTLSGSAPALVMSRAHDWNTFHQTVLWQNILSDNAATSSPVSPPRLAELVTKGTLVLSEASEANLFKDFMEGRYPALLAGPTVALQSLPDQLAQNDILNLPALIQDLQSDKPISAYIRKKMPQSVKLANLSAAELAELLNTRILPDRAFLQQFQGEGISPALRKYRANPPGSPEHVNRLLLQVAFPKRIAAQWAEKWSDKIAAVLPANLQNGQPIPDVTAAWLGIQQGMPPEAQKAAEAWVAFLKEPEQQKILMRRAGVLPAADVWKDPDLSADKAMLQTALGQEPSPTALEKMRNDYLQSQLPPLSKAALSIKMLDDSDHYWKALSDLTVNEPNIKQEERYMHINDAYHILMGPIPAVWNIWQIVALGEGVLLLLGLVGFFVYRSRTSRVSSSSLEPEVLAEVQVELASQRLQIMEGALAFAKTSTMQSESQQDEQSTSQPE